MNNAEVQALIDQAIALLNQAHDGLVIVTPPTPTFTVTSSIKDGATLTVPLAWTATPSAAATKVDFHIDGKLCWTESIAPYWFNGDGNLLDPATLSPGSHALVAVATAADGTKADAHADVTVSASPVPPQPTGTEGRVQFCMYATSQADKYTLNPPPTATQKAWMNQHWNRAIIYVDQIAAWMAGDWGYVDVLAIYTNSSLATQHPEWILKDAAGNKLTFYSSIQYLGDIGHPAYQDYRAQQIAGMPARNYKGVHCDDVNLDRVVNSNAINPRTGQKYTLPDWQRDFANMMTKVRTAAKAAKPDFEIVHNSLWWASGPDVTRCMRQADVYELERGFNDANYTAAKIEQLFGWCDQTHALGVGLNHLSEASGQQAAHFNMACALLCSNGKDFHYGNTGWQPDAWDVLFDANLGAATGPRTQTSAGVWERSFTKGHVKADLNTKVGTVTAT